MVTRLNYFHLGLITLIFSFPSSLWSQSESAISALLRLKGLDRQPALILASHVSHCARCKVIADGIAAQVRTRYGIHCFLVDVYRRLPRNAELINADASSSSISIDEEMASQFLSRPFFSGWVLTDERDSICARGDLHSDTSDFAIIHAACIQMRAKTHKSRFIHLRTDTIRENRDLPVTSAVFGNAQGDSLFAIADPEMMGIHIVDVQRNEITRSPMLTEDHLTSVLHEGEHPISGSPAERYAKPVQLTGAWFSGPDSVAITGMLSYYMLMRRASGDTALMIQQKPILLYYFPTLDRWSTPIDIARRYPLFGDQGMDATIVVGSYLYKGSPMTVTPSLPFRWDSVTAATRLDLRTGEVAVLLTPDSIYRVANLRTNFLRTHLLPYRDHLYAIQQLGHSLYDLSTSRSWNLIGPSYEDPGVPFPCIPEEKARTESDASVFSRLRTVKYGNSNLGLGMISDSVLYIMYVHGDSCAIQLRRVNDGSYVTDLVFPNRPSSMLTALPSRHDGIERMNFLEMTSKGLVVHRYRYVTREE